MLCLHTLLQLDLRLSQLTDAAIEPALAGIRVIGLHCCDELFQQEQGDAGVLRHWLDVTT